MSSEPGDLSARSFVIRLRTRSSVISILLISETKLPMSVALGASDSSSSVNTDAKKLLNSCDSSCGSLGVHLTGLVVVQV